MNPQAYEVLCCLPSIPDARFRDEYEDASSAEDERLTTLSRGLFLWLINIRPGYMVLSFEKDVIIEPYTPSRFTL